MSKKRSAKLLLEDICEAIDNIFDYTEGLDFEGFNNDKKTKDAVVRNFEIVGEAAHHLPEPILTANPQLDWSGIIGFRHRLIHGYFGVDYKIVWFVIENELAEIRNQSKIILDSLA